MDLSTFLGKISAEGTKSSDWSVSEGVAIPYPYWNITKRKAEALSRLSPALLARSSPPSTVGSTVVVEEVFECGLAAALA